MRHHRRKREDCMHASESKRIENETPHEKEKTACMQVNQRERIENEIPQEKERRLHCQKCNLSFEQILVGFCVVFP